MSVNFSILRRSQSVMAMWLSALLCLLVVGCAPVSAVVEQQPEEVPKMDMPVYTPDPDGGCSMPTIPWPCFRIDALSAWVTS
nr:hypothetical protein [Grimontia hollisae]